MLSFLRACTICEAGAHDIVCKRCAFSEGCHRAQPRGFVFSDSQELSVHEYQHDICKSLLALVSLCALPMADGTSFIVHAKKVWSSLRTEGRSLDFIKFLLRNLSYREVLIVAEGMPSTFGDDFIKHSADIFEFATSISFDGSPEQHSQCASAALEILGNFSDKLDQHGGISVVFWLCVMECFRRLWSVDPDGRTHQFKNVEALMDMPRSFFGEDRAILFYNHVIDAVRASLLAYASTGPNVNANVVAERVLNSQVILELFENDQNATLQYLLRSPYNVPKKRLTLFALTAILRDSSRCLALLLDTIAEPDRIPFLDHCYKIASEKNIGTAQHLLTDFQIMG